MLPENGEFFILWQHVARSMATSNISTYTRQHCRGNMLPQQCCLKCCLVYAQLKEDVLARSVLWPSCTSIRKCISNHFEWLRWHFPLSAIEIVQLTHDCIPYWLTGALKTLGINVLQSNRSLIRIHAGYSSIMKGLFHFEVWFSDKNVTVEYLRSREGQLCQRERHTTSNSSSNR